MFKNIYFYTSTCIGQVMLLHFFTHKHKHRIAKHTNNHVSNSPSLFSLSFASFQSSGTLSILWFACRAWTWRKVPSGHKGTLADNEWRIPGTAPEYRSSSGEFSIKGCRLIKHNCEAQSTHGESGRRRTWMRSAGRAKSSRKNYTILCCSQWNRVLASV